MNRPALPARATLRFVFPLPPNLANARMHWAVKHLKRQEYFAACDALQITQQLPPPPPTPWTTVVCRETLRIGQPMDDDNAAARCKWPMDWLTTRGYLADDSRKHVKRLGYPRQRIRQKPYGCEITLTVLEAD